MTFFARKTFALLMAFHLMAMPLAGQGLPTAPVPPWVEETPLPAVDPDLVRYSSGGLYWLLADEQVSWRSDTRFSHVRIAMKVLSRAGLEDAASVRRSFDPRHERLKLTRLDLLREGKRISLRDKVRADLLRREEDLDLGMIDGRLTALIEIPGLEVGDIVDAAFLWETEPLFQGYNHSGFFSHAYSEPVGLSRLVLNWPAEVPFHTTPLAAGVRLTDHPDGNVRRIEMTRAGHVPARVDSDMPPETDPWDSVTYSWTRDWNALPAALAPHYGRAQDLPPEWQREVQAIRSDYEGDIARAYAALRLVQDRIRYVGLEMGADGYFSRDPDVVIANGFGDCKDKSVLLVTLLRALGIEADVALTDLDQGYGLRDQLPAAGVFDHMIVRAVAGGATLWLDGTATFEGGIHKGAASPDFGFALPLTGRLAGRLTPILPDPDTRGRIHVTEDFRFEGDVLLLDVTTEAFGAPADRMRYSWAMTARADIEDRYLDYYRELYPGIEALRPIEFADNAADNQVRLTESYVLPAGARADSELTDDFPFAADGFNDIFPDPGTGPREAPLYLGSPPERIHTVRVTGLPTDILPPENLSLTSRSFEFTFHGQVGADDSLILNWHITPLTRTLPAHQIGEFADAVERMGDTTRQSWNLTRQTGFLAELFQNMKAKATAQGEVPGTGASP